jgi:hypothetical protein
LLPAVSVIPNVPAAVKLELTVPPPAVAVEVAVMVQTVVEVCTMPVIAEMFVKVKSAPVPEVDKVEQVMFSLPVTVNVIVPDVEVDADAANVTVGAVVSSTSENIGYSLVVPLPVNHVGAPPFALSVFDCSHPLALPV